jgi:hypothetical protein
MEDVERFDPCFSRKVSTYDEKFNRLMVKDLISRSPKIFEIKTKYGFFVSLNMENFKATKNWRVFCGECIKNSCFIFERICYNKKDKSYITEFNNLLYSKKENFSEKNTEFIIFCGKEMMDGIEVDKYVIEKDLEIVSFDFEQMRDLPTEKQMQEEEKLWGEENE